MNATSTTILEFFSQSYFLLNHVIVSTFTASAFCKRNTQRENRNMFKFAVFEEFNVVIEVAFFASNPVEVEFSYICYPFFFNM